MDLSADFFSLFDLPKAFRINLSELDSRYRDVQAQVHPDKFADADEAQRRSMQDVRAPGQWRANAALTQQAPFGVTFGCKQGTPMQPRKPDELISIFP